MPRLCRADVPPPNHGDSQPLLPSKGARVASALPVAVKFLIAFMFNNALLPRLKPPRMASFDVFFASY